MAFKGFGIKASGFLPGLGLGFRSRVSLGFRVLGLGGLLGLV